MDIVELNSIINELDITDIYKIIHLTKAEYIFFPSLHVIFTKIMFWAIKYTF